VSSRQRGFGKTFERLSRLRSGVLSVFRGIRNEEKKKGGEIALGRDSSGGGANRNFLGGKRPCVGLKEEGAGNERNRLLEKRYLN